MVERITLWQTIAQHYLDADEAADAEKFIFKQSREIHKVDGQQLLKVGFHGQQAKMKDSRRDFELAAWEYYRTSNMDLGTDEVDMADMFLKPALTCAILAPQGEKKFALMGQLYKDERSKQIQPHFAILERFFLDHIIKWSELEAFEKGELADHQKATDSDNYTVLFKATLEHNIHVLSKIYLNISFEAIGRLLGISAE